MRWNIFEQICKSDCHRRQKKRRSGVTPTVFFLKNVALYPVFAGTNFGNGTTGMEPGGCI